MTECKNLDERRNCLFETLLSKEIAIIFTEVM